jgi:hypothetical protein
MRLLLVLEQLLLLQRWCVISTAFPQVALLLHIAE